MNAATLMNSGTVTKKPAMKLRRSHCILDLPPPGNDRPCEKDDAEPNPVPREGHESGAPDEFQEGSYHQQCRDKGHHKPDGNLDDAVCRDHQSLADQAVDEC